MVASQFERSRRFRMRSAGSRPDTTKQERATSVEAPDPSAAADVPELGRRPCEVVPDRRSPGGFDDSRPHPFTAPSGADSAGRRVAAAR